MEVGRVNVYILLVYLTLLLMIRSPEFKELHQVLWWHWAYGNRWVNSFGTIGRLQTKIGGCHLVFLIFLLYRGGGWTASLVEYVTTTEFSPHLKLPSIFLIGGSLVFNLPKDSDQWMNRLLLMHVILYRLSICGRIPYNKVLDWYWPTGFPKLKKVQLRNTQDRLPSLYILNFRVIAKTLL